MELLLRRSLLIVLAAVLMLGSGCSKKADEAKNKPAPSTSEAQGKSAPANVAPIPKLALTVARVEANGTPDPDPATIASVTATLDAWYTAAVVMPLHSGAPAGDLSGVFTPAALVRLGDPAVRSTLVDEGLPPATKAITPEAASVLLSSVVGPDGGVGVVLARVDIKLRATGANSDVDVVHAGDLVLLPSDGAWKIDSFVLHTTRDSRA